MTLLGLVKTHFYHIWIQLKVLRKTKELRLFHEILSQLEIPAKLGRLPTLMGQPAGGSLTADQWLVAATVVCPVALPQIWDQYCTGDAEVIRLRRLGDFKAALQKKKEAQAAARKARLEAAQATSRKSGRKRRMTERAQYVEVLAPGEPEAVDSGAVEIDDQDAVQLEDDEDDSTSPHPNLHPDDPANFFKLASALKILLARKISDAEINEADRLLREYCTELIHLYGPDVIRQNHHYSTHIPPCIRDFGPLHGFWTFLFERINKVLKSYNSANHAGGELETSFFREFHRTVQQSRVMATSFTSGDPFIQQSIHTMYGATADDRGTVQSLARELDEAGTDGDILFSLSPRFSNADLPADLYSKVFDFLRMRLPFPIRSHISAGPEIPLHPHATFFDYTVILGARYWASARNNNIANSLVAVRHEAGQFRVGELSHIFGISQDRLGVPFRFGHVKWFVPVAAPVFEDARSPWHDTKTLRVQAWNINEYQMNGMDCLIRLEDIISHVVRRDGIVAGTRRWITILINRNGREQ